MRHLLYEEIFAWIDYLEQLGAQAFPKIQHSAKADSLVKLKFGIGRIKILPGPIL